MSKKTTAQPTAGRRRLVLIAVLLAAILGTVIIIALLVNIFQRQQESTHAYTQVVEIDETVVDPAVWGQNFPAQYEAYTKTAEFTQGFQGGTMEAHDVEGDPRTEVTTSKLEEDPRLTVMWAGYPFATDYRHARGHEWMTIDQQYTLRNLEFDQPGTCLNCHASMPAIYAELGDGDVDAGFHEMGSLTLDEALDMAEHPIACIDCHNPETMELQITRPAFERGIAALKASEGIEDYDVNRDATRQEMRSYVCAQCHTEYYFDGNNNKELVFPWANGLDLDDIWEYYQENGHVDYIHATTGAEILKAQHPEFDIWAQGVHAEMGVSCADCHMPYVREGGTKVTDHDITTPMGNMNAACGTCHDTGDGVLAARVQTIHDRFLESRDRAFDALVALIDDIEVALEDGTPQDQIDLARYYQNRSSFYLDYVYSENSYGFHAPDYEQRLISQSLDYARMGQLALRGVSAEELKASEVTTNNLNAALRVTGEAKTSG